LQSVSNSSLWPKK